MHALQVLSSFLLTLSYKAVASATNAVTSRNRKGTNSAASAKKLQLSREEVAAVQEALTMRESMMWSFYFNNSIFLCSFLFFAFYAFQAVNISYQYALSMIASSGLVWQLSSSLYTM